MRTLRPLKRSVSPFGFASPDADPMAEFDDTFGRIFPIPPEDDTSTKTPPTLRTIADIAFVPAFVRSVWEAPANDAPELDALCQFLVRHLDLFEQKGLADAVYAMMERLFDMKTDIFLIDHQDQAYCEKIGLGADHRDIVLFAKERDALVGRYFSVVTEQHPGLFSEFVTRWVSSPSADRLLHFLDFCAGAHNPTFEHYLVFTHPALARVVGNKPQLRALFDATKPVLSKLKSPTWEKDVRAALGV